MARLRQPRPQPQPGDENPIEDEIVQYAGEIKALKKNGLRDLENAYQDEVACVLQTATDLLMTTIHPSYVKRSLQKIATGELKPYFPYDLVSSEEKEVGDSQYERASADSDQSHGRAPTFCDPWLKDRIQRRTMDDEERLSAPSAKKRRVDKPDHEHSVPNATSVQSSTMMAFEGQQREEAAAINPSAAAATQPPEYDRDTRNEDSTARGKVALQIIDADSQPIAVIEQTGPWGNKRAEAIFHMPIKRTVKLRRAHGLDQRQLNAICDVSDKEGVQYVSCLIQACGDVMHRPCVCCDVEKTGPFETCNMVDDELFPHCGNCGWSGQLCRGALATAEEATSSYSDAHPAPEVTANTRRPSSPLPIRSQLWDVMQRVLMADDGTPDPISPDGNSQNDDTSVAISSCEP